MLRSSAPQAQAWLLHAVIWVLLAVLLFTHPADSLPAHQFYLLQSLLFAVLLGVFYLNVYWAVPRLLYRRRSVVYFGLLAVVLLGLVVPHRRLQRHLELQYDTLGSDGHPAPRQSPLGRPHGPLPRPGPGGPDSRRKSSWLDPAVLLATLLVMGLGTSAAAVQRGQHDAQLRIALEQEKLATELSLLKAQINPHFFFNTLNNIYALTLLDVERARVSLHRLSRMMRYVLYETPTGYTHLSQEVSFLRDYVELMHLRLTDLVEVCVETPVVMGEGLVADPLIAPMLFQPFLENAFKHGVSGTEPSRITIVLRQPTAQQVELIVRNTLLPQAAASDDEPGGIGLANTQRRLALLYPGRYDLRVTNPTSHHEYEVCLSLHLYP
jgi:two-component system LytT family sensor kinase